MHNRHAPEILFHSFENTQSIVSPGPIALKVPHEIIVQALISSRFRFGDLEQKGA